MRWLKKLMIWWKTLNSKLKSLNHKLQLYTKGVKVTVRAHFFQRRRRFSQCWSLILRQTRCSCYFGGKFFRFGSSEISKVKTSCRYQNFGFGISEIGEDKIKTRKTNWSPFILPSLESSMKSVMSSLEILGNSMAPALIDFITGNLAKVFFCLHIWPPPIHIM